MSAGSRAWWLKTLHQWHWISSALCLAGMLLFAVTGITLNHAGQIEGAPVTQSRNAQLPAALLAATAGTNEGPLPGEARAWLSDALDFDVPARAAEWSADEIYLALPRPGGDAWIAIDRASGRVEAETTDRGWLSYFNDLHKGRNSGAAWSLFIDIFAAATLVFSITGLFILKMHAGNRPFTWPMVGMGLLVPLLLALLLIH